MTARPPVVSVVLSTSNFKFSFYSSNEVFEARKVVIKLRLYETIYNSKEQNLNHLTRAAVTPSVASLTITISSSGFTRNQESSC